MNIPSPIPSPLVPQGSLLEQKNKGRSRVKLAFFCVVGVHVAALMVALLSQGCKREQSGGDPAAQTYGDTNLPALLPDTNTTYVAPSNVPPPVAVEPPALSQQEYVILRGDSYSSIAAKYPGVTAKAIQEANPGVDPLRLQIGRKIVIPPPSAAPAVTPGQGVTPPDATGEVIYVVKSGDRLDLIAKKYGTTARAIADANNLKTLNKIVVGQKLKIPVKTPTAPVDAVPSGTGAAPAALPPAR